MKFLFIFTDAKTRAETTWFAGIVTIEKKKERNAHWPHHTHQFDGIWDKQQFEKREMRHFVSLATAAFLADASFVFLLTAAFFVSVFLSPTFSLLADSTFTVFSTNVSFFAFRSLLTREARAL